MTTMQQRVVVGITGASGAVYAKRVIELLAQADVEVHLTVSSLGRRLLFDELGMKRVDADELTGGRGALVTIYNDNDVGAAIASGSFLSRGMLVVPASSNTLVTARSMRARATSARSAPRSVSSSGPQRSTPPASLWC